MTDITPENVARMLEGVTDRPWTDITWDLCRRNARFIAWAREAVPALSARLAEVEAWREDPESSDAWCAGNQFALGRLCHVLKVDSASADWDGSDGSLTEETDNLIWRIVQAHTEAAEDREAKLTEAIKEARADIVETWHDKSPARALAVLDAALQGDKK